MHPCGQGLYCEIGTVVGLLRGILKQAPTWLRFNIDRGGNPRCLEFGAPYLKDWYWLKIAYNESGTEGSSQGDAAVERVGAGLSSIWRAPGTESGGGGSLRGGLRPAV